MKKKEEEEKKEAAEGVGNRKGDSNGCEFCAGSEGNKLHARGCEDVSVKQLSA